MKKIMTILAISALSLGLVGCSGGSQDTATDAVQKETIAITHELGTTDVPLNPQKIAVLDYAALDIVDGLGEGDKVVGIPKKTVVAHLESYNNDETIAHLGDVKEIDMEALNSLDPDLIIIGGRLREHYDEFTKIAPTIMNSIDHAEGFMKSLSTNISNIASIFEKEDEAKAIIDGFQGRIDTLNQAAQGKSAIVALVSKNSVSVLGSDARCSMISTEVGFENLSDTDATHGDSVSFEFLVEKNPDFMFILDRDTAIRSEGAKIAQEVIENELVMETDAYKNGNIVYLTPDVWYLAEGGIHAMDIMLQDLEVGVLK